MPTNFFVQAVERSHFSGGDKQRITMEIVSDDDGLNIYDLERLGEWVPPSKSIIRCGHCGQWGAIKTPCSFCGAPIG